jgi:uncharacterized protein YjbI with pentapeptide repeats
VAIDAAWWKSWWEKDYSWEGLAKKPWAGWVKLDSGEVVPAGEGVARVPATLQDYWRDQEGALIASPSGQKFTPLHLPLAWPDGTPTAKAGWTPDRLHAVLTDRLARAAAVETVFQGPSWDRRPVGPDHRAQLEGVVLSDFRLADFADVLSTQADHEGSRVSLQCRNAAFSGDADFREAALSDVADFSEAAFSRGADFSEAAFSGVAYFSEAAFSGYADFSEAAYSGVAYFSEAAFSGYADFSEAAFSGYADFSEAAFSGVAYFSEAFFARTANFKGRGADLFDKADRRAVMLGARAEPPGGYDGEVVKAAKPASKARRSFASFEAEAAVFLGDVHLENRDILGPSSFRKAVFQGALKVHGATLHPGVSFHGAQLDVVYTEESKRWRGLWRGRAGSDWSARLTAWAEATERAAPRDMALPPLTIPPVADAGLKRLHRADAVRRDRAGEAEIDFEAWRADWSREWRGWVVGLIRDRINEESGRLERAGRTADPVKLAANARFADLESDFRALKHAMEQVRNRSEEGRFFKLELLARRERRERDVPLWERGMSDLYGLLADYGGSVVRPLGFILGLWVVFAFVYWELAALRDGWTWIAPRDWGRLRFDPRAWDALRYSGGRVFPFGAFGLESGEKSWVVSPACPTSAPCQKHDTGLTLLVRALGTFESLLAGVLAFLAALAARRRFQLT